MEQEQKRLLIRGARILNPARGEDYIGNILISGDRISAVSENLYDADAEVMEAKGLTAVPGFVDMHVHLRDPGFTDKEDIYTGCRAAAAGGVTSLLCMPNTKPAVDTPETVRYFGQSKDRRCACLCCGGDYKGAERRRAVRLRSAARCRRHCFERRRSPGHRYCLPCKGIMRSAEAPHARDGALRRFVPREKVGHA